MPVIEDFKSEVREVIDHPELDDSLQSPESASDAFQKEVLDLITILNSTDRKLMIEAITTVAQDQNIPESDIYRILYSTEDIKPYGTTDFPDSEQGLSQFLSDQYVEAIQVYHTSGNALEFNKDHLDFFNNRTFRVNGDLNYINIKLTEGHPFPEGFSKDPNTKLTVRIDDDSASIRIPDQFSSNKTDSPYLSLKPKPFNFTFLVPNNRPITSFNGIY